MPSIKKIIKILEKEVSSFVKAINDLVGADVGLKARSEIIPSVKGVGKITAWTILACLAEIEYLNRNHIVALAGIAPFNRDRDKFSGKRSICGGRAKVRNCLYLVAHSAATCNPVIAPYVQGLRKRVKPCKCAIVAAMRKLLIHNQFLLKKIPTFPLLKTTVAKNLDFGLRTALRPPCPGMPHAASRYDICGGMKSCSNQPGKAN